MCFCIERGNHRSCQSPRYKCSDITLCFVFKKATTEAVSRQYASALIFHYVLYSKRQPQKPSTGKTQHVLLTLVDGETQLLLHVLLTQYSKRYKHCNRKHRICLVSQVEVNFLLRLLIYTRDPSGSRDPAHPKHTSFGTTQRNLFPQFPTWKYEALTYSVVSVKVSRDPSHPRFPWYPGFPSHV